MRMLPLLVTLVAACSVKADFTGTLYHCGDNNTCPTDYVCLNTYCVPDSPPGDAGVDAAPATCGGGDLSLGLEHSCALRSDGSTWCWGRNDFGQVGDGSLVDQTKPVQVMGVPAAKKLAAGSLHTCALASADGTVWCWGHNSAGQLGDGTLMDSRIPLKISSITGALAVAAGDSHTCALLGDHTVACWGYNGFGQLGINSMADHGVPMPVQTLSGVTAIAAGGNTSCAVKAGGTVACWGENDTGAVGNNDGSGSNVLVPSQLPGLVNITSVSVGFYTGCAVDTAGQVSCWGDSSWGELGNGTFDESLAPVTVAVPAKVVEISLGQMHACARDDQHRMWCWGDDSYNQFGDGTRNDRSTPVLTFMNVDTFASGGFHTCIQSAGVLQCAGDNVRGELGFGQESAALVPTVSPALAGLTKLAAGAGFACGVTSTGGAQCWGQNSNGQLGDATFKARAMPASVFGLTGVTALTAGFSHACALQTGGAVSCWGYGYYGQLGGGTSPNSRPVAEPVVGLGGAATQISAGYYHTCAVVGGQAKCWGRGVANALDNNSATTATPFTIPTLTNVIQVAAGDEHTCALKMDGTVWCWGWNAYGQIGTNNTMVVPGIAQVTSVGNIVELTSFGDYNCGRRSDQTVWCWGEGYNGRLGNGAGIMAQPSAVQVLNVFTATKLYTGPDHACVLRSDNTLACWGSGGSGQIGDNTAVDHLAPSQINTSGITSAAVGNGFTCATRTDGTVLCWGDDHQGQLGDGLDTTTTNTVRDVALTCP